MERLNRDELWDSGFSLLNVFSAIFRRYRELKCKMDAVFSFIADDLLALFIQKNMDPDKQFKEFASGMVSGN